MRCGMENFSQFPYLHHQSTNIYKNAPDQLAKGTLPRGKPPAPANNDFLYLLVSAIRSGLTACHTYMYNSAIETFIF